MKTKLVLSQETLKNLTSNQATRPGAEALKSVIGFPRCTPMPGAN
jgi:hypothetical protein